MICGLTLDGTQRAASIRVDGGMAANDWFCQFLADVVDARVERPSQIETTAMGATFLTGLASGIWTVLAAIASTWTSGVAPCSGLMTHASARMVSVSLQSTECGTIGSQIVLG